MAVQRRATTFAATPVAVPASVNHISQMPSIRNQGGRGTCVAFALTAAHEFYRSQSSSPQDLSEQFLYDRSKQIDGSPDVCGTYQVKAAQVLSSIGECREVVWPYNPSGPCNNNGTLPGNALADAANFKVQSIILNQNDVNAIKTALFGGSCVSFSIPVYNSWYQNAATYQSGLITMRIGNEPVVAGHAMCFVGYQDDANAPGGGYFLLRNSWDGSFGTACPYGVGYGKIPYAYITQDCWEAVTMPATSAALNALFRYYNSAATDHFYTTNWAELDSGAYGWVFEKIQCYIYPAMTGAAVPLYRYWNGGAADHFYTTNWNELHGGAYCWVYEGIQGYVMPTQVSGTVPLYRYWNGAVADHFYTTNWNELGDGVSGYKYEGVQCFVYTSATAPAVSAPEIAVDAPPPTGDSLTGAVEGSFTLAADVGGRLIPFAEKAHATSPGATDSPPSTDFGATTVQPAGSAGGVTITISVKPGR